MDPLFKRKLLISFLISFVVGSLQADVLSDAANQPKEASIKNNRFLLKHSLNFNHSSLFSFADFKVENQKGLSIAFSPYFFDKRFVGMYRPLTNFGISFRVSLSF